MFKKLFVTLALVASLVGPARAASPIGTLGLFDHITLAGQGGQITLTDLANLVILHCTTNANTFCSFRSPNSTSGYTVSGTLRIRAYLVTSSGSGTSVQGQPLYGDTDVGLDSGSAPTTPIYIVGGNDSGNRVFLASHAFGATGSNTQQVVGITNFTVPNGKIPAMHMSTGSIATLYGYLE